MSRKDNHGFRDQLTSMRKRGVKFDVRGMGDCVRTIAVTIMCCHFLANRNWFDYSESNVAALTEELAVVVAVVLSIFDLKEREKGGGKG
jgi:hypothetical protein